MVAGAPHQLISPPELSLLFSAFVSNVHCSPSNVRLLGTTASSEAEDKGTLDAGHQRAVRLQSRSPHRTGEQRHTYSQLCELWNQWQASPSEFPNTKMTSLWSSISRCGLATVLEHWNLRQNRQRAPNWPTVGRMQRLSRAPLTDEELRNSPFGRLLPPSCSRMETSSLHAGTATVPSTPIPKAPSRYRNKIPSQWIEEDESQETADDRPPLQRTHSKSLPHIATWNDDVSSRCTCEVCKMGTITNKIYFPNSTLQTPRNKKLQDNRKSVKGEYDEIDEENRQDTIDDSTVTVIQREQLPIQDPPICAPRSKLNTAKTPPSPPPRGVPCKKMFREQPLDFSPIRTLSCVDSDILKDLPDKDNVSEQEESPPSSYGRPSMDSGIVDKHSEDEEITITRL
ncbi:hypothetical protein Y032_0094g2756 [Ancylostoma ceylanicum]|uniref:Uncharacterized protein n=1 Tax=Ancylostoma ceylanicum TaxID=53326 RepID=A0A016TLH9_9BILA|nr:hypothetical protein Y032_0094g2756 [Ancylostoma ceylanicum]